MMLLTMITPQPTLSNISKVTIGIVILYKLMWFVCYYFVIDGSSSSSSYGSNSDVVINTNCCDGDGGEEGSSSSLLGSGGNSVLLQQQQQALSSTTTTRKRALPSVLIIGARKCGTRALIDMLNLHPQVEKAQLEVHFFDRDENYEKGLEWYESQMPEISPETQISIEKSPSYFVTPEVPERVYGMNSTIKLLLIVREPVTRVISDYTQIYYYSNSSSSGSSSGSSSSGTNNNNNNPSATTQTTTTPPPTLLPLNNISQQQQQSSNPIVKNVAVPIIPPGGTQPQAPPQPPPPPPLSTLILHPDGSINTNYKAIRISIYSRYLQRWLDIFPTAQIHVIDGDAMIRDPFTQLQDVEKFLNLEAKLKREDFYFNSTKGFYCWKKHETTQAQAQTQHNETVNPSMLPSQQQQQNNNANANNNYNTVHCLNDSKGRKHPNVDRRIVRKLREFYKPFNQRFYEMVGRDFGWPES